MTPFENGNASFTGDITDSGKAPEFRIVEYLLNILKKLLPFLDMTIGPGGNIR
jgi:hypothetical protein